MTRSMHTFGEDTLGQTPQAPDLFEEDQPMANPNLYEPGPSFVPDDVPTTRLAEMPAWLQTFAAQEMPEYEDNLQEETPEMAAVENAPAMTAAEEVPEPSAEPAAPDLTSDDIVLPDWLQDSGPGVDLLPPLVEDDEPEDLSMDAVAASPFLSGIDEPVSTNPDTFISEDDLPDWLRAFSEEAAPEPEHQAAADPVTGGVLTQAVEVRVPPVENIWLSDTERRALGPGGTLFALLAANKETDGADEEMSDTAATGEPAKPATTESRATEAPAGKQEQDAAAAKRSRQLLLLTLAIVVLIILVSFIAFR